MENTYEEFMNNHSQKGMKKKKSPILIILILLIIVALIAGAVFAVFYFKKRNEAKPKMGFINYIGKSNFENVLNFDTYNNLSERMEEESSAINSKITADYDFDESSTIELNIDAKKDPQNEKAYVQIDYKKDEKNFVFEILALRDIIAINSDDIVIKYVGSKYENLSRIISEIADIKDEREYSNINYPDNDYYNEHREELEAEDKALRQEMLKAKKGTYEEDINDYIDMMKEPISIPKIPQEVFDKYIAIINNNVEDSAFSSKTVTLDRESGRIDVTEYSMSINEEKLVQLTIKMLETFKNDNELLTLIAPDEKYSDLGLSIDSLKTSIDRLINELYDKDIDNTHIYTLKVYGANDITYKVSFDIANEYTIDFDYEYGDTNNSIVITLLETESQNGLKINFERKNTDVSETLTITANVISDSDIIAEAVLTSSLVSSGNSYTLKNRFDLNYMLIKMAVNIDTSINFKNVEIDELTNENCMFLDELDKETLDSVINGILDKIDEVTNEETNDLIGEENPTLSLSLTPQIDDQTKAKDEAKQKIIDSVSAAMGQAQAEGRTYILTDLMDLEIPDTEFSVSIDENIATLNVDGFEFTLDADFNLSY